MVAENHPRQHRRRQRQIFQRDIRIGRIILHLRLKKPHLALGEILHIQRRRCHQDAVNFHRRNIFGIQEQVNIEILLYISLRLGQKLRIADACRRVLDAVLLREDASHHIHLVLRRHRNQNIRAAHVGIVHRDRACAIRRDCQHVQRIFRRLQPRLIPVNDHHIVLLPRQKLGNAVPQLPRAHNHDSHTKTSKNKLLS